MSTERLDQLLDIFKVKPAHKRAKRGPKVFTLTRTHVGSHDQAVLQGARGKVVMEYGPADWDRIVQQATEYVAAIPGATLEIHP